MKVLIVLTLLGALVGCPGALDEETTATIGQYLIDTSVQRPGEDEILAIAQEVESFAGYYCANGDLVVAVTASATSSDRARIAEIVSELGVLNMCYSRSVGPHVPEVIFEQKRYNFLTLRTWRDSINTLILQQPGAHSIGIRYSNNRIVISTDENATASLQAFMAARLPFDGYEVTGEPRVALHSACPVPSYGPNVNNDACLAGQPQCCFRPVPGGVSTFTSTFGGAMGLGNGTMTLGADRFIPEFGYWQAGFVTCAHCVPPMAVMNQDFVDQHHSDSNNNQLIAIEYTDPPMFGCQGVSNCRKSDSAWLWHYDGGVARGAIAQTQFATTGFGVPGSKVASAVHPRFFVRGKATALVEQMQVDKVGQTTGWTTGVITDLCSDINNGIGQLVLCNAKASLFSQGGDSGSPVFYWWSAYGADTVELVGILWGSNGVDRAFVSKWSNVEQDLGNLNIQYSAFLQTISSEQANDIGVGSNGSVWIITNTSVGGGNYTIKRWNGVAWDTMPGAAARIAVNPSGNAWVVNAAGGIYQWTGSTWEWVVGSATDVGIGANGNVWVVGTTPVFGGFQIYAWSGSYWTLVDGGAVRIAVDPSGNAWVTASDTTIHRRIGGVGGYWQPIAGGAVDVGIGGDGMVWVLGSSPIAGGFGLYWWTGIDWVISSGAGTAISVDRGGRPWTVNSSHQISRAL
jgi:hypothetical protein